MQIDLFTRLPKDDTAIQLIQSCEPPNGYYGCYSGGKDSEVVMDLTNRAISKVEWHYHRTGVDAPETIRFIRTEHPEVIFDIPKKTMWQGITTEGLPLRTQRWCCGLLKECFGKGRVKLDGVRAGESTGRKVRNCIEVHSKDLTTSFVHPIFRWSVDDIWDYIDEQHLKVNPLYYTNGKRYKHRRLGCLLCPMTTQFETKRQMDLYPKFVELYRHYGSIYFDKRLAKGNTDFKSFDEYFSWWIKRH